MFSYLTTIARQNWTFGDQMAFLQRQAAGGAAAAAEEDLPEGLLPLAAGQKTLDKHVVPFLERYAPRASHDKDLVQWPVTDQDNSSTSSILCRPVLSTLQSKHSRHEAFIKFVNTTPHTIRLLWLDYDGHEVAYDLLEPHYSCIQQTFATHPWVAREVNTATCLIINGQEAFCAQRTQPRPRLQQQQQPSALAADNAPAAAAAAGEGAAGQQQQQAQRQQEEERYFLLEGVNGVRRVPYGSLQVAVISVLPRLPWSEAAHTHFPASFKAAVQTFLMCHHQLQHSLATDLTHTATSSAGASHHASTMPWCPPASPSSSSRTHLGHIPHLLLPTIVGMAAPFAPQHAGLPQELRPDIGPTLLPEDPNAQAEPSWFQLNDSEDGEDETDDEDEDEDDQEAGSDDDEGLDEANGPAAMALDGEDGEVVEGGGGVVAGAAADGFVPLVDDAAMEGAD